MLKEIDKEKPTIGMLLDIEHIYGGHEGRMGPIVICLCTAFGPPLLYVYYGLWSLVPIWLFVILDLLVTIKVALITLGKERERKEKFKKQLYSDYSEPAKLMNIKTIHRDGCIEFINGTVYYLVCCFNGTCDDEVQRSVQMRKLHVNLIGDYEFDTYIFNINEAPALREYYKKVATFEKSDAAVNFIHIIDHSLELVENNSIVLCTVYAIRGHRSDWKDMAAQIDTAINSKLSRCYKSIHRVTSVEEVSMLLNRDADTVINVDELLREKYATQNYGSSKVLAYDLPDDKEIIQGGSNVKPIIPIQKANSFHTVWVDTEEGS